MNGLGTSEKTCWSVITAGLVMVGFSAGADYLGLDITPGIGLFQITGILLGITLITVAAFFLVKSHQTIRKLSLVSDVGMRMGLTGLLACYVSGMADILGVGTHRSVRFDRPFFGPLQLIGFSIGLFAIIAGLLMFWFGYRTGDERTDP
jgi:hypothetical protein